VLQKKSAFRGSENDSGGMRWSCFTLLNVPVQFRDVKVTHDEKVRGFYIGCLLHEFVELALLSAVLPGPL
jgi:hypothetical protein